MSDEIRGGEVIRLGDRFVVVAGVAPIRNWRGAIAVRNTATGRLSYLPEWKLRRAKQRASEAGAK